MPDPIVDTSIEFLQNFRPGGPWVLCGFQEGMAGVAASFDGDQVEMMRAWVEERNTEQLNVYFHVNRCRPELSKKAEKADVVAIEWLHVDLDPEKGKPLREERNRILKQLENYDNLPKPTVIIFSGGGYQAFWKLAEPIEVNGDLAAIEDAERYNIQIATELGADNCHNADRIMRLPGTVNWPNKKKRDNGQKAEQSDVVVENWGAEHDLAVFVRAPAKQVKGEGLAGGANRPEVAVPGNVQRIPIDSLLDALKPYKITDEDDLLRLIIEGHDSESVPMPGKDRSRSAVFLRVVAGLVRREVPDDMIYAIVTDRAYKISEHPVNQGRNMDRAYKRAMRFAKEELVNPMLAWMNERHAHVLIGGKSRYLYEYMDESEGRMDLTFLTLTDLNNLHANKEAVWETVGENGPKVEKAPLAKWWNTKAERREYRTIAFWPNREFDNILNLWRGFAVDAMPGDCSLYLAHIKDNICRGNQDYYDYLLKWMANAVQNPDRAGQVAVVLRGGQGNGKGTFAQSFGRLFGMHYKYISNPDHITGQFNNLLRDAVVVFADECFAAKDKKQRGALKSLITEPKLRTESKGVDAIETRNCVHLIMATNNDWAIAAEGDDRRFFVLHVGDDKKQDGDYFKAIMDQLSNGGYEALMHHLLTMDLSGFNVFDCPKTDELRVQQDRTRDGTIEGFVTECFTEGELIGGHGWRGRVLKDEWVDALQEYCGNFVKVTKSAATRWLKTFLGTHYQEDRTKVGFKWGQDKIAKSFYIFPQLDVCRRLWDERFGAQDWPVVDASGDPDEYEPEPGEGGGTF